MKYRILTAALAVALLATAAAPRPALALTDEDVTRAIERAKEWLINRGQTGTWPQETADFMGGRSCMALYTLVYAGELPDKPHMVAAIQAAINRPTEKTYVRSMRVLALTIVQNKLPDAGRADIRRALALDVQWLIRAQGSHGGWNYTSLQGGAGRLDLSNTQMAILALWQAVLAGIEVPAIVWERSRKLYYQDQQADGGWNYGDPASVSGLGYGSMTAAGLASIYIIADMLDLASGCPCQGGKSGTEKGELNRRSDAALAWLSRQYAVDHNPEKPREDYHYYWLYSAERVGQAAGYKYFGAHDWYKEGAAYLVQQQAADGSWHNGDVVDTCFATLFLCKGRAPILYQKLQIPDCDWNPHRRDLANITSYIEHETETPVQWQIATLTMTMEELHEAPILYLSLETAPKLSGDDKKKLRAFTDTGGTILIEPSCGAPAVKAWFENFAKEVWPEWPVRPLGPDHGSFIDPNPLKQRPEVLGIDDGLRTCVFYAIDDISCPWQTRAMAAKEFMFKWGINLFTYATDHSPLRAKLAVAAVEKDRYAAPVRAGVRSAIKLSRLKTDGDWTVNQNYRGLERIAAEVGKRATLTVELADAGADPTGLGSSDAAYLTGSKTFTLAAPQQAALKDYLAKGGFLWAEAAGGSTVFDESFRKLAKDMGWKLKKLEKTAPAMTGQFKTALGYDLTQGVQCRRSLKLQRGKPFAEFEGIYQDDKLVGLYSPFDVVFSCTPYEAYACKGYRPDDAMAVALNILAAISDR
jgi:hypothetical protein